MLNSALLEVLVCPENKTPVKEADAAFVARLNAAITAGTLKYRNGETVEKVVDGALIREDNAYCYLVREDIPIMLIDEAVAVMQISAN